MRSDKNVKQVKRQEGELGDFGETTPRNSFSGGERDNLFLSDAGRQFYDLAGVSGLDDPGDGRTSGLLDYDRDGWTDLVVASSTEPSLQLYRNQIGEQRYQDVPHARMVAVSLVGGNSSATPSQTWSPRDGYGAILRFELADGTLLREHRCGDGRAGQNSSTMLVGVGEAERVERLTVTWSSGKTQQVEGIPVGTHVTLFENAADSESSDPFILRPYAKIIPSPDRVTDDRVQLDLTLPNEGSSTRLNLFTAMSTHCASCKKAQPQVAILRNAFGEGEVGVYGIPVDLDETAEVLDEYVTKRKPHYEVLSRLPMEERRAVKEHIKNTFLDEITPATIITDGNGTVLRTMQGVPTLSEVKQLLHD